MPISAAATVGIRDRLDATLVPSWEDIMTTMQPDRPAGLGLGSTMLHGLAKNWWLMLLRGIAAIIFGVLAFVWPGLTLLTLILLYGAFAFADGVLAIAAAVMGPGRA